MNQPGREKYVRLARRLDVALVQTAAACREWAAGRSTVRLVRDLRLVLDQAATGLGASLRNRIQRALDSQQDVDTKTLVELRDQADSALRSHALDEGRRLRGWLAANGVLFQPDELRSALEALQPRTGPDGIDSLIQLRRELVRYGAAVDRIAGEIRDRWHEARSTMPEETVRRVDDALGRDELVPAVEALEENGPIAAESDRLPFAKDVAELAQAVAGARHWLSPDEMRWIETVQLRCPIGLSGQHSRARSAWLQTIEAVRRAIDRLLQIRQEAFQQAVGSEQVEEGPVEKSGWTGFRSVLELIVFRDAVRQGRLEGMSGRLLHAEWELSRALWEHAADASLSSCLEARRAFQAARQVPETAHEQSLNAMIERLTENSAAVRYEAAWKRRWRLRHDCAYPEDRDAEMARCGKSLGKRVRAHQGREFEEQLRHGEADLRHALARTVEERNSPSGDGVGFDARRVLGSDDLRELERIALTSEAS